MAFGLKLRKTPKDEIKRRVEEAARILGIEPVSYTHLDVYKRQIYNGERKKIIVRKHLRYFLLVVKSVYTNYIFFHYLRNNNIIVR